MKDCYLIRGLPGSGKSTKAKALLFEHHCNGKGSGLILESDQFFMKEGSFQFNLSLLGQAHADCQKRCFLAMYQQDTDLIIVANTFPQLWEMEIYKIFAGALGYQIQILDLFDAGLSDQELAARCVHGAPVEKISQMRARWERDEERSEDV